MAQVNEIIPDKEIQKQLCTVIKAKASIAFANRYDKASKRYTGDNRALLMEITLNFWEKFEPHIIAINEKLDVITLLTKRTLLLEDRLSVLEDKQEVRKMNDGTEVPIRRDKHE